MANDDSLLMLTPDGKKYSVPRSQVSAMTEKFGAKPLTAGLMQTKPGGPLLGGFQQEHPLRAIPPTILQSFGIDPAQVEGAKGYLDALKIAGGEATSEAGEQMFESMMKAGPLAPVHMVGKGIDAVATGIEDGSKKAFQAYQNRDRYGMAQGLTQVASSLGQMALLKESKVPEKTAELTGKGIRGAARMPVGIGSSAEEFARSNVEKAAVDHAAELRKITQEHELEKRAFDRAKSGEAIYRTDKAPPEISKEAGGRVSQGPVKQRLMNFSDRVGEVATKTKAAIKNSFDRRYNVFRKSLGENPQVDWTPVQLAVKDAEENILQGSPDSLSLFRNMMRESPQLDDASVFKTSQAIEATGNMKEILQKANPNMRRQILANLAQQGITEADIEAGAPAGEKPSGLPGKEVQIPHKDAWGYAQELNAKMNGSRLPPDVFRAFKSVRKVVGEVLQDFADTKNVGPAWKQIQSDYAEYAQAFTDPDSPASKLINATNPEDRLALISGKEGQNLIDILHQFRGFGGDTEIAGKVRALQAAASKSIPELTEPKTPVYPKAPEAFDPAEWRRERLREYQEKLASRQPATTFQYLQLPMLRFLNAVYSNPAFIKLILGIK